MGHGRPTRMSLVMLSTQANRGRVMHGSRPWASKEAADGRHPWSRPWTMDSNRGSRR
jgi:hypothetical protein